MTGQCSIDGCQRPLRSRAAAVCNIHYHRLWRTGRAEQPPPKREIEHSGGYILERMPDHPVATAGSRYVYQHRRIYYDAHGIGPFCCHVCSETVGWDTMHVDHLDDDPTNNELSNLAPACPTCNQCRGKPKMVGTRKAQGRLLTFGGETLCLSDWAKRIEISPQSLRRRLISGWPIERALTEGRGRFGPERGCVAA